MPEEPLKTYTSQSSLTAPLKMFHAMFKDLYAGRELAWQLAVRDIRAQYRQAALGLLWAFILPLAHTLTWIFLNATNIITIEKTNLPYPIYVFTGTMLWAVFTDAVNGPLAQTISAKHMLAKINFPREAIVVSGIYQTLFNGVIKIMIVLLALLIAGIHPGWNLIWFPIGFLSLILIGTTIGLLITPLGMLYTDIGKSMPLLLQFLMYLCPVIFPMPAKGTAAFIFTINPLTPLITNSRNWLTGLPSESLGYFLLVNILVLVLLFLVWIVFRAAMPILIERISA